MVDDEEMKNRILAELEEAHWEDAAAMFNSVITPSGHDDEKSALHRSLSSLVHARLIDMTIPGNEQGRLRPLSLAAALAMIDDLGKQLQFDKKDASWVCMCAANARPTILLSASGLIEARRLLAANGYQWWKNETNRK